jgi:O-methyltransferase
MLLRVLKEIFAGRPQEVAARQADGDTYPNEVLRRTAGAHAGAPMERHLEIALGDIRVGDHDLRQLTQSCLDDSDSKVPPLKALHRPLASYFLSRYFMYAMKLGGQFAECGVFRGTSALFLCRAARIRIPAYAGEGLHLIDSFEGISEPAGEDYFDARGRDGSVVRATVPQGALSAPVDAVRNSMRDFPKVQVHQGWIPAVFQQLPDTDWAFVHVDVDLYEPTRDCLEYFYPRLNMGGVIVCDDYGSLLFPGARRAWDQYCEKNGVPFVVLDTGQSVILKA